MVRIISALILAVTAACAFAQEPIALVDNPPDRHVVVRGDTLWGISAKFLKEPWRWPEIWQLNKDQIKNPHLIYPGDVVMLDMSSGSPRLRLGKGVGQGGTNRVQPQVYSENIAQAIPSIPPNAIEPFISQPLIVSKHQLDKAPFIVATQEYRIHLSPGDIAYVKGINDGSVTDWQVFEPGKPLKDPDTDKVIGYEAFYLGNAKLIEPGAPALISITAVKQEMGRAARLVPAGVPHLESYMPHAPVQSVSGKIVSLYGNNFQNGPLSIIAINRGQEDGLEAGHVLALSRTRISTNYADVGKIVETKVPEERYGLAFVFRTFDKISYALVMEASKSVLMGDNVRNP